MSAPPPNITINRNRARPFYTGFRTPPMSSATVSLVVAVVGVCGTLASAIATLLLSQRAKLQELKYAERQRLAEQDAAKKQQLRSCYVQLNANDRNYRDALLAYAYALRAGSPSEAESAEVSTARRAQRDARAEAQMAVSDEVLKVLKAKSTTSSRLPIAA